MTKVTVVIPVFNRTLLLARALESVNLQTFQDFEVIVVDDHSTEDIQSVALGRKARYLKSLGKGVSAARNTGIQASNSPLIAFLDSDDEWHPSKLMKQIAFLDSHPDSMIVHTNELWIRNGQLITQSSKHRKSGGRIFSEFCELCLMAPSSVCIRKSIFETVGYFDQEFPVCEDFELWLRIAAEFDIGFLSEPLTTKHGGHPDQLSRQLHSMDLWRVRALKKHLKNPNLSDREHLSLRSSLSSKCDILLKGFKKHQNFEFLNEIENTIRLCQD